MGISSMLLYNWKIIKVKILFTHKTNIQIFDLDLINKFVIYKLYKYVDINIKDYNLCKYNLIDFKKFAIKHFHK